MAEQRNFARFQSDFEKETGLKLNENIAVYISYCQLREAEATRGNMATIANFIADEIRKLKPGLPQ